jgi:hypothetical protein
LSRQNPMLLHNGESSRSSYSYSWTVVSYAVDIGSLKPMAILHANNNIHIRIRGQSILGQVTMKDQLRVACQML